MRLAEKSGHPELTRTIAARIDVIVASGALYANWRSGYANLGPGETVVRTVPAALPATPAVIGINTFTLHSEDVTPPPWNQPPYPPAGDTDTGGCTVEGRAP